jgi:hypothetical protein
MLDRMATKAVDVVSRSMMDAFIRRAETTLPVSNEPQPVPLPLPASAAAAPAADGVQGDA